jgi:glycosyltransferase involved in cell wall biosynthesis
MRGIAESRWGIRPERLFVVYSGLEEEFFASPSEGSSAKRDPFACVYLGYPSKGLGHAREVLRRLRGVDPRFHLDVFGGHELRQEVSEEIVEEPGLSFRGLLGQRDVALELHRYSYCIALQQRQEPFGIVVIEAQRAGVVVVASEVGALPELIRDGINGFLIGAEAGSQASYDEAVEIISFLSGAPEVVASVSRRDSTCPWSWDLLAQTWLAHRRVVASTRSLTKIEAITRDSGSKSTWRRDTSQNPDRLLLDPQGPGSGDLPGLSYQAIATVIRLSFTQSSKYGEKCSSGDPP